MQYEIFDDFKDGMVLTAIPLQWFRAVTDFIKGFGGGGVIKVRTENGTPNVTIDTSISQKANMNGEMSPYKNESGTRVSDSQFDGDTGADATSWGINEQNDNDKNGCILTVPTRFETPLKDDSQTERDKSKVRMFFRSIAKAPSGITSAVTREIGYKDFAVAGGFKVNAATDISGNSEHDEEPGWPPAEDIPAAIDPAGKDEIWAAGTTDAQGNPVGYTEDSVVAVKYSEGHILFYVKKEYSSDGRLLRVRKYSDGGGVVYVGA